MDTFWLTPFIDSHVVFPKSTLVANVGTCMWDIKVAMLMWRTELNVGFLCSWSEFEREASGSGARGY